MTGADVAKLTAAGFRVFYMREEDKIIFESTYGQAKKFAGPFKSKAEMGRAWAELMKNPKHISR